MENNISLGNNIPNMEAKRNPFIDVHKKQKYRTGQKALTQDKVQTLLENITDLEHLGLIQLAIATGMRREDIVNVKTKDINIEKNKITYYESKKKRTKTVYIPQNVANTISMIIKINKKSPYIFPGSSEVKHGKGHISGRTAYNIFNKYLKRANLEQRPFHALRATCIKLCQSKGWSIEQTAEHIGDTIRVIQEHYTTPSDEEMKDVTKEKPLI